MATSSETSANGIPVDSSDISGCSVTGERPGLPDVIANRSYRFTRLRMISTTMSFHGPVRARCPRSQGNTKLHGRRLVFGGVRSTVVAVSILFFSGAAPGSPRIEYVKEDHPPKLEGVLARIQKNWVTQKRALAKATVRQYGSAVIDGENITVVLEPRPGRLSESIDFGGLSDLGVSIVAQSRSLIEVSAPIEQLERVAEVDGVQFVRLPIKPKTHAVVSEGVERISAQAYSSKGYTGRGIRVGVIDIGFVGVPSLQSQGELPELSYRDFTNEGIFEHGSLDEGASVHGSACAEIVHDVAPDAVIHLYKVGNRVDLENAKDAVIQEGLDIVTVSLGWNWATGFGDGTGLLCNIVDDAFQNNVLWVNAAGNEAKSKISVLLHDPEPNQYHNFEGGNEIINLKNVRVGEKVRAVLTWNEWPLTSHDYDLLLVRIGTGENAEIVERADTKQLQSPPIEFLEFDVRESGTYGLAIWRASDAKVTLLKLYSPSHELDGPVSIAGSLSSPADARGALTIGALHHWNWMAGPIADYSSQGPTVDGRIKPDLVAPAGVRTISYGSEYRGTSAATPHVAGAAALLKSSDPVHYNARNLKAALMQSTVDMGDPGPDNVYGAGRLDLSLLPVETPVMRLSRSTLDFGAVVLGSSQTLNLGVVNTGQASLAISDILLPSGDYDLFPTSYVVPPARSQQISVTFTPQSEGDRSGNMTILSNLAPATVTLRAQGIPQRAVPVPRISVASSPRDFGSVEVGSSKSTTVTVTNIGDASLSITDIVASDDRVRVVPTRLVVPPKQNGYFTLRFEPDRVGDLSARVTIHSNDANTPAVSFPVIGKARQAQTTSFTLSLAPDASQSQGTYVAHANGVIAVAIHGQQVKDAVGFRAVFDFDAPSLAYAGFDIGSDIPNGQSPGPHHPDTSSVEVMAASFGSTIRQSSANLGTVRFRASNTFETGEIRLRYARIRRTGKFETFTKPLVLRFSRQRGPRADFDGDGAVGFADFIAFASRFGLIQGDEGYDARYDLDGNGAIGFSDFVIFAGSFGA